MTKDEIDIETYRYRAPSVIPLNGGRFAVLTPGLGQPYQIVESGDCLSIMHDALTNYIEWNVLPEAKHLPKEHPNTLDKLASLGLTDAEMDIALSAIITKRKGTSA